jgi:hypothetical protein
LSPRAACRLATIGFTRVHDYGPGKVDWLAHALPVEGTHAEKPTAGTVARRDVATCAVDEAAGDVLARIADSPYGFALVMSPGGVVLGRARRSAFEGVGRAASIEPSVEPGPSTVRPHLTIAELQGRFAASNVHTLIVTTPEGVLLGVVGREDVTEPS